MLQSAGPGVNFTHVTLAGAAAAMGSLAPDLDHPYSKASYALPTALLSAGLGTLMYIAFLERLAGEQATVDAILGPQFRSFAWTSIILGVLLLMLSLALGILGHRGPVHSIGAGLIASLVVAVILAVVHAPLWLVFPFAWGWIAHLLADATTPTGVACLLWPLESGFPALRVPPRPTRSAIPTQRKVPAPVGDRPRSASPASPTLTNRQPPTTPAPVPDCPRCGVPMVVRTAKRGAHVGSRFYGCSNFPRCRQTRPIAPNDGSDPVGVPAAR